MAGVGWIVGAVALVYVAAIDFYAPEQLLVAVLCTLLIIFLRLKLTHHASEYHPLHIARLMLMVAAGFLAIRYMIWRFQYSIPWQEDVLSLACSLILLAAEVIATLLYFLGMLINVHPLRRESVAVDINDPSLPTVDVFVPTYDEDPRILRTTLLAATSMYYPEGRLKVYLLDDGGTEEKCNQPGEKGEAARMRSKQLQHLCHDIGCTYLTRKNNKGAKAGNINAALPRTNGDVVVIFDADHVPTVEFLELTIGTLVSDERIALVQTPHFMINRDPLEKNLKADRTMPNEGEMFYTVNLRSMDNWNAGFFCGSGALLRRKALEEIGGIASETIVEDAETSLALLRRGWKTAYIHKPILAGLTSESVHALVVQRSRWAEGMVQLLRLKRPLTGPGLSLMQRLSYFNCIIYWLFSASFAVFILVPLLALFFGLHVYAISPKEILLYLVPHLIGIVLLSNALYGRVRWLFVSEIYETIYALFLPLRVLGAFLMPRHFWSFKVTPKGESLEVDAPSRLARPMAILCGLEMAAAFIGVYLIQSETWGLKSYLMLVMWNTYNLMFSLAALGVLYERRQLRFRPRIHIDELARIKLGDTHIPVKLLDMTEDGALIRLPGWIESVNDREGVLSFANAAGDNASESLTYIMHHLVSVPFDVVSVRKEKQGEDDVLLIGVRFDFESIEQRRTAVNYIYGKSDRWRSILKQRNRHSTLKQGFEFLLRAIWLGLGHFLWHLRHPFARVHA